ncbi:2-hydroxyacid dehydrogenase [Pseudovibrio japonicus]|uniref:2-hydroxyacid dehydrogenase n=1 Tax=Pseudovibrio japonicus TaxID=366534 RepID=A0ABQ3EK96_9HYPH|nr:hydroxyacid dehydrogenase [Pseudovibrio japonicus]GHB43771.1 2-hydroxyacid dehydrogenase [Pseudovibrio japonicus]
MKRIVITEFMAETALDDFESGYSILYDPALANDRPRLLQAVHDTDALIVRNKTVVDQELLNAAPKLKVVGRLGVGLDNFDLIACQKRKVQVKAATGANAHAVAEYVIGAVLTLQRNVVFAKHLMLSGNWPRESLSMGNEIQKTTMGFIGFGNIAKTVAEKARALGMKTIAYDPYLAPNDEGWQTTRRCKLNEVFREADALSLHVPLTDETRHMVNEEKLDLMKTNAVLINTARGGVVDEGALVRKLKDLSLTGAALDVFENEPLTYGNASIFDDCPNLILTPHIAGVTVQSNLRVSKMTVKQVKQALEF